MKDRGMRQGEMGMKGGLLGWAEGGSEWVSAIYRAVFSIVSVEVGGRV